jgi:putative oxidoreductase
VIPERYAPYTYALFRIVFGLLFLFFGLQKTMGWFGGTAVPLMTWPGGFAGIIETVAGCLIMIGLFTRLAAFLASGEMAVAFFYVHVMMVGMPKLGIPAGLVPQMNGGVDSVLFCFAFLYIASRGAGVWSADAAMGKK